MDTVDPSEVEMQQLIQHLLVSLSAVQALRSSTGANHRPSLPSGTSTAPGNAADHEATNTHTGQTTPLQGI